MSGTRQDKSIPKKDEDLRIPAEPEALARKVMAGGAPRREAAAEEKEG